MKIRRLIIDYEKNWFGFTNRKRCINRLLDMVAMDVNSSAVSCYYFLWFKGSLWECVSNLIFNKFIDYNGLFVPIRICLPKRKKGNFTIWVVGLFNSCPSFLVIWKYQWKEKGAINMNFCFQNSWYRYFILKSSQYKRFLIGYCFFFR